MIKLIPVVCITLLVGLLTTFLSGLDVPLPEWLPKAAMTFVIVGIVGLLALLAIVPWLDERGRRKVLDPQLVVLKRAYAAVLKEHNKDGSPICTCDSCNRGRRLVAEPKQPEKK